VRARGTAAVPWQREVDRFRGSDESSLGARREAQQLIISVASSHPNTSTDARRMSPSGEDVGDVRAVHVSMPWKRVGTAERTAT